MAAGAESHHGSVTAAKRNARDGLPVAVASVCELGLRAAALLRASSGHRRVVTGGAELVLSCCRSAGGDYLAWCVRGAGPGGDAALHDLLANDLLAQHRQAHDRRTAKAQALDTPPHLPSVRHRVLLEGMLVVFGVGGLRSSRRTMGTPSPPASGSEVEEPRAGSVFAESRKRTVDGMSVPPRSQVHGPPRSGHTATRGRREPIAALSFKSYETRAVGDAPRRPIFFAAAARAIGMPGGSEPSPTRDARMRPPGVSASTRPRPSRRAAAGSRAWRSARPGSRDPRAPARCPNRGCDRHAS